MAVEGDIALMARAVEIRRGLVRRELTVVRVGVTVYRYVSLCNARHWLIHTLKNNRGRGWRSDWGQEDVVTLTGQPEVSNTPDPSSRPETNGGGARTDSGTAAVQKLAPLNVTHRPAAITAERGKGDNENSRAIQPGDPCSALPCSEDAVAATASSSTTGIATGQRNDEDVFPSNETAKPAGATQRQHGGKDGETQRQAGHEDSGPPSASTGTPSDAALGSSSSSPQRRAGHEDSSAPSGALLGSSSSPPGGAAPPGGAEGEAGASSQPGLDADDTQDLSQRSNPPARLKRSRRVAAKKWNTAGDLDQAEVQPNSTYEKIRLRSRMWRRPEGGLNAKVLSGYLNSIQFHLMRHPGVSLRALTHHYRSLFTPVDLRDLLEILEQLGCVRLMVMKAAAKASLFSPQSSVHITQGLDVLGASDEQLIIEPVVDCCHRLGQFLTYIK